MIVQGDSRPEPNPRPSNGPLDAKQVIQGPTSGPFATAALQSKFRRLLVDKVSVEALKIIKRHTKKVSKTIAADLIITNGTGGSFRGTGMFIKIRSDYYWAEYVHNGHGPITPSKGKLLAFYPTNTKRQDPRLGGKYNRRLEDIKYFEPRNFQDRFDKDRRNGRLKFAASSPAQPAKPFFKWAEPDVLQMIDRVATSMVVKFMREVFDQHVKRHEVGFSARL